MNISYNWLKKYIALDLEPEAVSKILTSIGLEVGGVEEVETIKGGLQGLVVGAVVEAEDHPNSDHLHVAITHHCLRQLLQHEGDQNLDDLLLQQQHQQPTLASHP